jgi:hypothetical protein
VVTFSVDRVPASLQWWACAFLGVVCIAGASTALWLSRQFDSALARLSTLAQPVASTPGARGAPAVQDFALNLGPALESPRILSLLDQATRSAAVVVQSAAFTPRTATANTLGQLEVNVVLLGSYAASKQVLAELHSRLPQLTLRQLRMVPVDGQPGQLQTQVVLVLWSAPLPAPAASGS